MPDFVYGAAIILVMILLPSGAGGLLRRLAETPNNPVVHFVPRGAVTRTTHLILCALGALALATVASGAASDDRASPRPQVADRRHDAAERARPPPTSRSAKGAAAYFRYVNAKGGVNKRKIKYIYKDDALRPGQDERARRASSSSRTRSSRSSTASAPSRTSRRAPYLNAIKVPQLFVASGATTCGKDYKQYPWTIGYQPNYRAEGTIYGRYVAKTSPKARIGVLYQNDDYGKDLLAGLDATGSARRRS